MSVFAARTRPLTLGFHPSMGSGICFHEASMGLNADFCIDRVTRVMVATIGMATTPKDVLGVLTLFADIAHQFHPDAHRLWPASF